MTQEQAISDAVRKVCAECGSEDVWYDATAVWDVEHQMWELGTWFDDAFCVNCDTETTIVDRAV